MIDTQALTETLSGLVQSWHEAVENPAAAQEAVLQRLLRGYAATEYGQKHGASQVASLADYRRAFPIVTYKEMKPLVQRVMGGDVAALLSEPPLAWAITRGTTADEPKFVPITPAALATHFAAGRCLVNFSLQGHLDTIQGVNLNLNFPSVVGTVRVGDRELEYGYSSGIYVKHVAGFARSLPTQQEIDALGGGKSIEDWNRRFELAYERCRGQNVTYVGGVAPTAVLFGKYLRRRHGVYPRDLWKPRVMTLGSVPGINTRYRPALRGLYGEVEIREIYGATEGIMGQQRDQRRAWVPNYDLFLFEVLVGDRVKLLHEMRPGEFGNMVVSTPVFPRYRIGDVIVAGPSPYFRCIGREGRLTRLRYYWDSLATFDFGRI
ncbi:MAG: GH3 family domain-containing protein [Chloroflexota bacterium]